MNKTINISLGKQFFYIDEEAYVVLKNYLDAIKRYLVNEKGRDEILSDIETRIAELFIEKLQNEREVVQLGEVERVIQVMGQPSDYKVDDDAEYTEENTSSSTSFQDNTSTKKFYRDEEKNLLGGVCAGLAHNFAIDIVWMRLIWLVLFFLSYGTATLLYIVLWIVVPAAKTTAQKLAMMGEPINISNIEKKVKENAEKAATYAKNFDYEKAAQNGKSSVTQFFEQLGEVLSKVANVVLKILGFLIVLATGIALVSLVISLFSVGSISIFGIADFDFGNDSPFIFDAPVWLQILTFFMLAAVPIYFLFLLGLKLINTNLRLFTWGRVISLLILWFLAIAYISFLGIRKGISTNSSGEVIELIDLPMDGKDTLQIMMKPNLNFSDKVYRSSTAQVKFDPDTNTDVLVGTSIYISVQPSTDSIAKLRISKSASGINSKEARENATHVNYGYSFQNNKLLLDAFYSSKILQKEEDYKVTIVLYLPENQHFKMGKNVSTFKDYRSMNLSNLTLHPTEIYQLINAEIICTNCTKNENENEPKTEKND